MGRSSLEECRHKSVTEVMQMVVSGSIPLDYGPWLRMSPEGLDLMKQLTHRHASFFLPFILESVHALAIQGTPAGSLAPLSYTWKVLN